jgi:hypothetical protein
VALADYSQDADATGELVDVGDGTSPADYKQDVAGKMVLASGELAAVHRLGVLERGAAGILSDFPNQRSAWSGDDRDLVRWRHLSPYETRNRFAFMISKRQSEELRARLRAGAAIVLRARVRATLRPTTFDVVNATIQGPIRTREKSSWRHTFATRQRAPTTTPREALRCSKPLARSRPPLRTQRCPARYARSGSSGCRRWPGRRPG